MVSPAFWYIFLEPVKKSVTSTSGIILEEDKGDLDPHVYKVISFNLDEVTHEPFIKEEWRSSQVICNDSSGTNVVVQWQSIKVVTPDLILGFIS